MDIKQIRKKQRDYFLAYTIFFIIISSVVVWVFQRNGKSFVWGKDGAAQHYPTLVYIHRYLREACRNLLHGRWQLPMVDFSIGEGMDVLTTLNYYGFGDPLTLTALFCPESWLEGLYALLIFVRLYLSGAFFSCFCFCKGHRQRVSILAGALVYAFCGYALYASVRHPFFANGMMYLPLYLLGIERIIRKRKYGMFSGVVALSLISNFYFGYMNTMMMALYVLFYLVPERAMQWKAKGILLLRMIGSYLCGVLLSGVIMVPMVMAYLTCSRGGEGGYTDSLWVYPKEFYQQFFASYVNTGKLPSGWTNLGFSILCLVGVIILFIHRPRKPEEKLRNHKLQLGFIILTGMLFVPLMGRVMNGFGYASNRWNYAYAMLNAYILVCTLPVVFHFWMGGDSDTVVHALARYLRKHYTEGKKNGYRLLQRIRDVLHTLRPRRGNYFHLSLALCAFIAVNLSVNVISAYMGEETDYLDEFDQAGDVRSTALDSPVQVVKKLRAMQYKKGNGLTAVGLDQVSAADKTSVFYRVEQPWIIGNQSLMTNYFGHNWYFSIAPEWYFDYYNAFQLNAMERTYSLRGLDGRTVLNELTSTRYYMTDRKKDGLVPYGYCLTGKQDNYYIYKNQKYLPLGYTTSAWMKQSEYDLLSPIEKQQVLMQSVVLDDAEEKNLSMIWTQPSDLTLDTQQEFCRVASCSGLTWEKNQLHVNEENATIRLTFQGRANCETYLWLNEFQVIKSGKYYQVGTVTSDDTTNYFVLMNPKKSAWYDEPNQTINLGYSKTAKTECTITFPAKGVYSLDDFMVIYEPMDRYDSQVQALQENHLEHLKVSTNRIEGEISLSKTKFLQMSIPYSSGWTATVNGKKAKIYQSNNMYMALELPAGKSHVVFRYTTPYLPAGILSTAAGGGILLIGAWRSRRRKRSGNNRALEEHL